MRRTVLLTLTVAALAPAAPAQAGSSATPLADVSLEMTATDAQTAPSLGPDVSPVTYTATMSNAGPQDANGIHLGLEFTGNQPVQEISVTNASCASTGSVVTCDAALIPVGGSDTVRITTKPASTSDLGARGNVTTFSTDPRLGNNFAAVTPQVVVADPQPPPPPEDRTPPDTTIISPAGTVRARSFRVFRGRATDGGSGVQFVQVALQRVRRGRCQSLDSGGRFRTFGCRTRLWLAARGRGSWSYRLGKPLVRGTYRIYARAGDSRGLLESGWSRPDGNVVRFAVK
jgi:hypothetical protein